MRCSVRQPCALQYLPTDARRGTDSNRSLATADKSARPHGGRNIIGGVCGDRCRAVESACLDARSVFSPPIAGPPSPNNARHFGGFCFYTLVIIVLQDIRLARNLRSNRKSCEIS